jgi:nitrite reductase/ring-hydroxylating ferredoxin subunit
MYKGGRKMGKRLICKLSDIPENDVAAFQIDGYAIALVRSNGNVYALEDC